MSRPLVVCDCDEVLLHMVAPFASWLSDQHGIDFSMVGNDFSQSMRYRKSGEGLATDEILRLLNRFFEYEMDRQLPISGAVTAIAALAEQADVVVLTNLGDHHRERRTMQLHNRGIAARVFTNQGPKGPALQRILAEYRPSCAFFIDDLPQHHGSVAEVAPNVTRLHLCGEPLLAPHIACAFKAGHAHARIDEWSAALPWLLARLQETNHDG